MKKQANESLRWHPGITIHKIPVVGMGGIIATVGIVVIALLGLPIAKWFLAATVLLGFAVACILRLFRRLHPQTEVEEIQLDINHQI